MAAGTPGGNTLSSQAFVANGIKKPDVSTGMFIENENGAGGKVGHG